MYLILGANSYMFRHQGAIFRKFINDRVSEVQQLFMAVVALNSVAKIRSLKSFKTPDYRRNR